MVDGSKIGSMYVVFGETLWQRFFWRALYKIAEVDYDNHFIIYFKLLSRTFTWVDACIINHRNPNPSEEEIAKVIQQASALTGIDVREFVRD